MSDSTSLVLEFQEQLNKNNSLFIFGLEIEQWLYYYFNKLKNLKKRDIFVCDTEDQAERVIEVLNFMNIDVLYFPPLTDDAFSTVLQSDEMLLNRFMCLQRMTSNGQTPVVTTFSAIHLKMPPKSFLLEKNLKLSVSDIISPHDLSLELIRLGYSSAPILDGPGTFSRKGEVFDIFSSSNIAYRLTYFDDMIENIFEIEIETLKSLKEKKFESIFLSITPYSVLSSENILNFRTNLPRPLLNHKQKIVQREAMFQTLNNNSCIDNLGLFLPLFFMENTSFFDFVDQSDCLHFFNLEQSKSVFKNSIDDMVIAYNRTWQDKDNHVILPQFDQVYYESLNFSKFQYFQIDNLSFSAIREDHKSNSFTFKTESITTYVKSRLHKTFDSKHEYLINLLNLIQNDFNKELKLIICFKSEAAKNEIYYILENNNLLPDFSSHIIFQKYSLSTGFYSFLDNTFYLSDNDFFAQKSLKRTKRKKSNNDLFADQLASLKNGDFIIHKSFGVGKYLGIETIKHGEVENDFLLIEYLDGDKIYLPVYKLNLVQKFANDQGALKLDDLKTKRFETSKNKARSSVKKLAFDLLELQAKRKLKKGFAFKAPDHLYHEFELSFPFQETPDQLSAIEDVLSDMQKETPMDRLVCGDVGFGKTEVAMRAAFCAILSQKQVAVLVPTTVLALQHFHTFKNRFKDFAVNIDFISRFKTAKEVTKILDNTAEGKVDILIGTHKLLSDNIKFKDLGLLIVDEEQRFGVAHKEKLKLIKENIDYLVLTATPIPRTLQMSFLGIKELSVIQTPPAKRQSIKTFIIKQDDNTLKHAITKELSRGGQIFVVHNRVNDINEYAAKIKKLVPEARIVIAHGQMPERDLEKYINDFYQHKYDILVSTTIIESGIDIPSANTMIVDRADTYGLSQLHQLRGRIGRSDRKAFAYFIIPSHGNLSEIANKRLKALQNYADVGSGFSLATSDLEIRGSGDILGAEQSGHISSIGLELYMELLQEAIQELQGKEIHFNHDIEIQTQFASSIPKDYIQNHGLRLKYYKRLSNCHQIDELEDIMQEFLDQYGPLPDALINLHKILQSRIYFQKFGLQTVKVQSTTISLNFNKEELNNNEDLRNRIINFFTQRPKVYQVKPNYSVICQFKEHITTDTLLNFAKHVAQQIELC
jgi:transcription-repair coupling factor (superfamily II helicase)